MCRPTNRERSINLARQDLVGLLQDICHHSGNQSLVVLDLLGRYSIEWPHFWSAEAESEKVRDYTMSYLYSPATRKKIECETFPLRFWSGTEVKELADELTSATGVGVEVLKLMDRSLLVGRHTDTQEYNPRLQPIRRLINSLHEDYLRTNLEELLIESKSVPDHPLIAPPVTQTNCLLEHGSRILPTKTVAKLFSEGTVRMG